MGAGCSNGNALAVQDSVTKKISLTIEGKEHLKHIATNSHSNTLGKDTKGIQPRGMSGLNSSQISEMRERATPERKMPSPTHNLLWEGVETNDIKAVEELLEKLAGEQLQLSEVDLYDSQGNSVAHKAASLGHVEVLMLLLERTGSKPDIVNAQLATPLHLASKNNRDNVAKFLIGCGVDVNGQDENGQTPLLLCCIHGNYDIAQLIIESSIAGHTPEPLEVDARDHRGLTSLNCAAIKGDLKLAKLLIEKANADVEQASPKGCTPLIYTARGGCVEFFNYLIKDCKASPLKQDSSGATLLHHAVEKGNISILQSLIEIGRDLVSAIEIADNAGRTPIFEAVDNNASAELMNLLIKKRQSKNKGGDLGGFGAKVNAINYNGQTPLFSAVREGNMELVRLLVEEGGAEVDSNGGEMIKDESDDNSQMMNEEEFESPEEKNFMEAYKNCMTPLQLSCILGNDDIALYLIDHGHANPNLQTNIKGYACLHLAVLANKPEMLIELLTRTNANHNVPDYSGRTFIEMVEQHMPFYLGQFNSMLENLQVERLKRAEADSASNVLVAVHYYNPDDEREIKGLKDPQYDLDKHIEEVQLQEQQMMGTEPEELAGQGEPKAGLTQKRFLDMDDSEIDIEEGKQQEKDVEYVFGRKIALGLMALNFKYKELALKVILKHAEKLLSPGNTNDGSFNISEFVRACVIAVDLTCKEKVIKVFNLCLQLLTLLITSAKLEHSAQAIDVFKRVFTERSITLKLLQRSEEGNTRLTNKIHECLLDYSFHPRIGEAHVSSFILQRIISHNKQGAVTSSSKPPIQPPTDQTRNTENGALGSYKGLLAQLALLYKFVNSFGVSAIKRGPLNIHDILNAILPSLYHQSQDVRSASTKILLDIQRLSGAVKEEKLASVPEKHRQVLIEKLRAQTVEKEQNQAMMATKDYDNDQSQDEGLGSARRALNSSRVRPEDVEEEQQQSAVQDWTGSKDQSLKNVSDYLSTLSSNQSKKQSQLNEEFLTNTTVLLKSCLEDNNFNLYLQAIDVASAFFQLALYTEVVLGSLQSLVKPVILRTTDTNTRMRKKSVELIYQIWSQQQPPQLPSQKGQDQQSQTSVPQIVADVICDPALQERAIIGRIGLFIKRASMIEGCSDEELIKKPHQVVLGRNYEQLMEFACQWCIHKNTKVRQNALKLIVEICRVNSLDPRGLPFKQRIINMILSLRASLRDQLVPKINEVCIVAGNQESYIDVNELELNLATAKSGAKRAASMDVRRGGQQAQDGASGAILPDIGGGRARAREGNSGGNMPDIGGHAPVISMSAVQPQVVLVHSEPLSEEQKAKSANLIELFGQELVQCYFSQFWQSRQSAIEKVDEQLYNLDPNRRDAMSAEINRKNLPIEETFKIFLEFIEQGIKDPVLKNLIATCDLLKKALPTFFRYLQPQSIKRELMPVVSTLIKKTTDLKAKVREVVSDFCLYLSHQSPIGPEVMVNQVLTELELILIDQSTTTSSNVAANMGNSHMIAACFKLLNQFQLQAKILDKTLKTFVGQQQIFVRVMAVINSSLRHQNPQVRKEGEAFFKTLYTEFGDKLDPLLTGQKPQLLQKLLQEAKSETGFVDKDQQQEQNLQRAQSQIRTEMLSQSTLSQIIKGQEENLAALRLPNVKKRLAAVVELRKAVQKELVGVQSNPTQARAMFEPLSILVRQLLADEEPDIYLETLGMLRAVVSTLVPHMSTLDVHLMLGQFIGVIVSNTVSGNIRTQIQSDKVIIFFAKHSNIGPFVVAKDILKNIEKCIKAVQAQPKKEDQVNVIQDKKSTILRFLSILLLLLQHFSIVLCYQPEFYDKCVDIVADSFIILAQEDQSIKNLCIQLIVSLQKIDAKILDQAISKMEFSRKTPLRKAMIELDNQQRAGKNVITQDHHQFAGSQQSGSNMVPASPMAQRDTRGSNMTQSSRSSLFSPGTTLRGASPGGPGMGMTTHDWGRNSGEGGEKTPQQYNAMMMGTQGSNSGFKNPEGRAVRRMISLENENPRASQTFIGQGGVQTGSGSTPLQMQARHSVKMFKEEQGLNPITPVKKDLVLPDILTHSNHSVQPLGSTTNASNNQPRFGLMNQAAVMNQAGTKVSLQSTGGAGFSSAAGYNPLKEAASPMNIATDNQGGIRPPLYVPQKRDMGRAGTGMLSGAGIQGLNGSGPTAQSQPQVNPLNRTGPLPSTFEPPGQKQFKTDFNSNLYSGLSNNVAAASSSTSTSSSQNIGGARSSSLQKKPTAGLFKPQMPQAAVTFETNVAKYKEPVVTQSKNDEMF